MKKFLFLVLITASVNKAFSQSVSFGVKAGFNLSEMEYKNPDGLGKSLLPGFNAGGILDISFTNFSIQPGIFYTTKGEKDSKAFVGGTVNNAGYLPSTTKLGYIEVPINFFYKDKLSQGVTLNLGGGPYWATGISDKLTVKSEPTDPYSRYPYRNPDYGVNFIVGLTIKSNWLIDAGYSIGLQNLQSGGTTIDVHNRVISLSLGYLFK